MTNQTAIEIERVQTGVRIEKRLLKVLKAVSELKDMTLGDLLEGIVLHAFEGKTPFSDATLKEIEQFRKIYGLTLKASDSHQLKEKIQAMKPLLIIIAVVLGNIRRSAGSSSPCAALDDGHRRARGKRI